MARQAQEAVDLIGGSALEDMSDAEKIAEIHAFIEQATLALSDAGNNPYMRALRFPSVSSERFASDPLTDALAKLRQLAAALQGIGSNPMMSGAAKMMLGM